ncbi:hypothetical protein FA13DRAFT_1736994 [Coprinellus micaceus]|uniref:Uncharacterized protein n=1 Tax=Coprinellus micaceus TaxID=71717 RepID=A0A4Y7SZX5_COPMI|nr:hypothetical protein FA13DRAFT_1736994 [Coprinellus micaceus]
MGPKRDGHLLIGALVLKKNNSERLDNRCLAMSIIRAPPARGAGGGLESIQGGAM